MRRGLRAFLVTQVEVNSAKPGGGLTVIGEGGSGLSRGRAVLCMLGVTAYECKRQSKVQQMQSSSLHLQALGTSKDICKQAGRRRGEI